MNRPTDNERLFADALADTSPAGFREGLLGETLRQARRRRHFRQARRVSVALGIFALLAIWLQPRNTSPPPHTTSPSSSCQLIETQPLRPDAMVSTQPFTGQIVVSVPTVSVFATAETGDDLRVLTDDELLALAPAPAALVRLGPHSAELVLANQSKTDLQQ